MKQNVCAMVKSRYTGDGHPTFNRNPYNGYMNPYYWVDDHPLLYGNNGSLDPGTYETKPFFLWPKVLHPMPGVQSQTKAVDLSQCDGANPKSLGVVLSRIAPGGTKVMNAIHEYINQWTDIYIYYINHMYYIYMISISWLFWVMNMQQWKYWLTIRKNEKSLQVILDRNSENLKWLGGRSPTSAAPYWRSRVFVLINSGGLDTTSSFIYSGSLK